MRSFNDWYFDLFESGNGACLNQQEIAEEAWDYRQTEVDELQASYHGEMIGHNHHLGKVKKERDELQKRVDAVQHLLRTQRVDISDFHKDCYGEFVDADDLEQALKGGYDE